MTQLGFEQGEQLAAMYQHEAAAPMISDLDHRINYGRAAIGLVVERISTAVEGVVDTIGSKASTLVESMPKPGRKTGIAGIAAAAIGSTTPALAAPTYESMTSTQGSKSNIRYYRLGDPRFEKIKRAKKKDCEDRGLTVSPYFNSRENPSGLDSNQYVVGRFVFPEDGTKQVLKLQFRKGFRFCAVNFSTRDGFQFIPPTKDLKFSGNKVSYVDPVRRYGSNLKYIATAHVWSKKK